MREEEFNSVDPLKNWIKEAGIESPGPEFHLAVLKKIEVLPKLNNSYTPVISPIVWKLIFGFIGAIFGGTLLFIPSNADAPSLFDKLPAYHLPKFSFSLYNFSFPTIDLSPPLILSIVTFFILGFLMIVGTIRNKQAGI